MKRMIRFKKTFTLLSVLTASTPVFSYTLDCPRVLSSGTYIGHFTHVIDRNGWPRTNYIFTPIMGMPGCVQIAEDENKVRYNLVANAFLLNYTVVLSVSGEHEIAGVGYGDAS